MKICIIGGGTTGWWCASYMQKFLDADITLIESDEIPISGVGESTLPQIKTFFDELEIPESEWMKECNAIHKYGNIKYDWNHIGSKPFYTTFWQNNPKGLFDEWYQAYQDGTLLKEDHVELYNNEYIGYHLDATLINNFMRNYCKDVEHIVDTITDLPQGYDLYVDATGFERRFTKDSEEIELNHHLVNSAWVYSLEYDGINPFTKSIARTNGWQFEIDLQNRTGTGYVFSDEFINDNDALKELKSWTTRKIITEPKLIKWKPSVLKNAWSDNVVTVGLGQMYFKKFITSSI
jgi:tryptophan halogenase